MLQRNLLTSQQWGQSAKVSLKALFGLTAMATPTFLKYLPARLKPLRSPAMWAPLAVLVLLGIFVWEYRKDPARFSRGQVIQPAPESELTEIQPSGGSIDALIEGTSGRLPAVNSLRPGSSQPGSEEAAAAGDSDQLSGRENPFDAYAADYQFPGATNADGSPASPNAPTNSYGRNGSSQTGQAPNFNFGSGLVNPAAPATNSALSEAIGRQQAERAAASSAGTPSGGSAAGAPAAGNGSSSSAAAEPARVPGTISAPYIRTTPNMSPPAGTTGYQTPATSRLPVFNIAPQQPSRNPYSAPPAPAAGQTGPDTASPNGTLYTAPSFVQPQQNSR